LNKKAEISTGERWGAGAVPTSQERLEKFQNSSIECMGLFHKKLVTAPFYHLELGI